MVLISELFSTKIPPPSPDKLEAATAECFTLSTRLIHLEQTIEHTAPDTTPEHNDIKTSLAETKCHVDGMLQRLNAHSDLKAAYRAIDFEHRD